MNTELNVHDQMSMPFWGHYCDANVITYILQNDLNNTLQFEILDSSKLFVQLKHQFKKIDNSIMPYILTITISDKFPIAPAVEYKKYLSKTGLLKTLSEKSSENKNIEKLYGALHIYLWGDGRTIKAIDNLQGLGLKNLWLGYDQDPRTHKFIVTPAIIQKAISAGYLIGPYDSFHTMENPEKANSINNIFDDLYPKACILDEESKINIGFDGKGCHISSEALALQ